MWWFQALSDTHGCVTRALNGGRGLLRLMREIVEYQPIPSNRDPPRATENHVERAIERATKRIPDAAKRSSAGLPDQLLEALTREGRHGGVTFGREALRSFTHRRRQANCHLR